MIFRTKVGFSHWWQVLLLFLVPFIIIILYNSLNNMPYYISICVYSVSALCPLCGLIALSAVLKTDYIIDENCLVINYNREKPLTIRYDRIVSVKASTDKKKTYPYEISCARSNDSAYIGYLNDTAKRITVKISPINKNDFIEMLTEKLKDYRD